MEGYIRLAPFNRDQNTKAESCISAILLSSCWRCCPTRCESGKAGQLVDDFLIRDLAKIQIKETDGSEKLAAGRDSEGEWEHATVRHSDGC